MILAGQLKHKVRFERCVKSFNSLNEAIESWSLIKQSKCKIVTLSGKESFEALRVQSDSDSRIECRYSCCLSDLSTKDRAVYSGRIFDIKSVINVNEHSKELHILVREHHD